MSSNVFESATTTRTISSHDQILDSYPRTAQMTRQELVSATVRRLHYELDLPAGERESAVLQRLRTWLALDHEDTGRLARAFSDALAALSPEERGDLEEIQQDAIYNGLTFDEFERLSQVLPSLTSAEISVRNAGQKITSPYVLIAAAMAGSNL